ncbi:uroporphyrinogen-III synthase [Caulobacter sp. KR2-114]|uniref:uroporphyrinogen-III synthase n=1 Tax=Caulobacter sp. KR2-114 TaxID=3400912 RepID=UPI003BFB9CDB
MADARKRIWVTRASPGAEATAARLTALGLQPVVAPLLQVRPIADARLDLTDVCAIAFTSANGVRAFAERAPERGFKVFAVGAATAEAARKARFSTVLSTDGDVAALARALASRRRELTGVILHPGAAEPAGDLAGELEAQGLAVRAVALYETVEAPLPEGFVEALPGFAAALLHSPKAARVLKDLLKAHPTPSLKVFGLSKAVIRPLQRTELAERAAAPEPNEPALLALLQRRLAASDAA